jgi:signal transduction histidine kinase
VITAGRSVAPAIVAGATVALGLTSLALLGGSGESLSGFVDGRNAAGWLASLILGLLGALVLRAAPGNALGPILAASGLTLGIGSLADALWHSDAGRGDWAAWAASICFVPALLLFLLVPTLYPHGRLPSARWRPVLVLYLGAAIIGTVCVAFGADEVLDDYPGASNPLPRLSSPDMLLAIATVCLFAVLALAGVAVISLVLRMRHAPSPERARLAWFVAAMLLLLADVALPGPAWASLIVQVAAWSCLGVGVLRYQLFDIETVLSRSLVYAVLTGIALLAYLGTAALVGAGVNAGVVPALATALAALGLASARQHLQRTADLLLYGQRRDPVAALTALGERLESSVGPDEVLPAIVDAARQSLRLPYASVILAGDDLPAVESGQPTARVASYPLEYGGLPVGVLGVGLRRGDRAMSAADDRVLSAFAGQAAAAAQAARVTRDLRRSRERIVLAREEERRRLRRDLHDGLGPTLAGISLGLETAGRTAAREGFTAAPLIDTLQAEVSASVEDVRRIVADLRPPALDEIGLLAALRQYADLVTSRFGVVVTVTGADLPPLPAAVEVAAYRIAIEGVTNAARHADARTCQVHLVARDGLRLTVEDDGNGTAATHRGIGLTSMAQRAEELGGTCTVVSAPGRGTRVEARLP